MKFFWLILVLAALNTDLYAVSAHTPPTILSVEEQHYADYLAGVLLLNSSAVSDSAIKIVWYKRLEKITGFNSQKALSWASRYTNSPEAWGVIMAETQKRLTQP